MPSDTLTEMIAEPDDEGVNCTAASAALTCSAVPVMLKVWLLVRVPSTSLALLSVPLATVTVAVRMSPLASATAVLLSPMDPSDVVCPAPNISLGTIALVPGKVSVGGLLLSVTVRVLTPLFCSNVQAENLPGRALPFRRM